MRHLRRAAIVLAAVIVIAFVVPRLISPPPPLEAYGFYSTVKQENALDWANQPLEYADPIRCNTCHADKHSTWTKATHATVSCENCHGPGERHIEAGAAMVVAKGSETCAVCHATLLGRPDTFPQIDPEKHAGTASCVTCHDPHAPGGVR